jgi:hypothetical protein
MQDAIQVHVGKFLARAQSQELTEAEAEQATSDD